MKKTNELISLARKLAFKNITKLAIDANAVKFQVQQSLQTALTNASSHSTLGIMPFPQMQAQDGAGLSFDITRDGSNVTVTNIQTSPPQFAPKYAPLAEQVKSYLEKYLTVFPTMMNGDSVDYSNFTVRCQFAPPVKPQA